MGKSKIQKYKIITLNPQVILDYFTVVKKYTKYEVEYCLDFTKSGSKSRAIMMTDEYNENPLFEQMRYELETENKNGQQDKKHLLFDKIIFLDFTKLFQKNSELKKAYNFSKKEWTKEELFSDSINDKMYFLFKNGFYIQYENKKVHYVPFDGSASMLRACRISFIDEELKDAMDERLCLGMDFSTIQVRPHKYFAYRGLYLTDCIRTKNDEKLVLDENTVIVIEDSNHYYLSGTKPGNVVVPVITAIEQDDSFWDVRKTEENPKLNSFDGEGMISSLYADVLNEKNKTIGATSYQIRMPFIKGMLHKVDFHEFFREYGKMSDDKPYYIKDVYGIERDLNKAQIILTKSMFKCYDWVKDYAKLNHIEDPMTFFFAGMKKYNHGLYIAKTNLSLISQKVKINYQYLCTLNLTKDEFETLVKEHIDYIEEIKNNPNLQREILLGRYPKSQEETWKVALFKNKEFLREPFIREKMKGLIESYYREIYMGQLRVEGENRFLSGDLLGLLIDMLSKSNQQKKDAQIRNNIDILKKQAIRKEKFLLPKPTIKLCSKMQYAFLRNPHLSRNEECAIKPYIAKKDSVHDKYFGELSGVVMVSYQSLAPMVLGGADFDGDMVKIISNKTIVKAVERGKKNCSEIVMIPGASENLVYTPKQVEYKHIKDTYGNRVGQISNIAIRLGSDVYTKATYENMFDENGMRITPSPAECTLLTGLEIDAAKNGKHPNKNIDELAAKYKGKNDDYISTLEQMKKYYKLSDKHPRKNRLKKKETFESVEKAGKKIDMIFNIWDAKEKISVKNPSHQQYQDEEIHNIELLPGMYLKAVWEENKAKRGGKRKPIPELFAFPNEENNLDIEAICKAYGCLADRYSYIKMLVQALEKRKWLSKSINLMKKQYDNIYAIDKNTNTSLTNIYTNIYELVEDVYGNDYKLQQKEIGESLKKLEEMKWFFAPIKERKKYLSEILPDKLSALAKNKEITELLSNFDESGYFLLFYLLKDLEDVKLTLEQKEEAVMHRKSKDEQTKEEKEAYERAYEFLLKTYKDAISHNMEIFVAKAALLASVKNYIKAELKLEFSDVAGTIYRINPGFFWKLFKVDGKEINIASFIVPGSEYQKWKKNPTCDWAMLDLEKEEDIYFC